MDGFGIFKIFQIFGIVSAWATKAFADGKVTLTEAVELALSLCAILGIATQLDIPTPEKPPGTNMLAFNDRAEDVEGSGLDPPVKPVED